MSNIKEGDIVLCTVQEIKPTSIFVKIEDNGEGTIITSEIAPGRIRNIRDYVVPNKKIVCKVLGIENNLIHLSARRVSSKEKKEVMEKYQKVLAVIATLKAIVKENPLVIIEKIKKEYDLLDFLEKAKQDSHILEKFMSKEEAEKLHTILKEKKEKDIEAKKEFVLKCKKSCGISVIKNLLSKYKDNISYLGASHYLIRIKAPNYKQANTTITEFFAELEKQAKAQNTELKII